MGMSLVNPLAAELNEVLDRTREAWEELRGGRLFLTGGTGFFGCWILESFLYANERLSLGASAVVLTRNPEAFRRKASHLACSPAVRLHTGDVADFSWPAGQFSHVIHAASELSTAQPTDPPGLIEQSVRGTRRVLELSATRGVRKLLLTSSGAVYGPATPTRRLVAEDEPPSALPLEPRWAYAEAKRAAELMCATAARHYGFEAKIARCFAFVGPHLPLDAHFAVGNFIQNALARRELVVQSSGTAVRSYLYASDLAGWLWTILFRGAPSRAYNVGSGQCLTILEVAEAVARQVTPPLPVRIAGRAQRGESVDFYAPDIGRAWRELGLDVWISLEEALRRTLQWHRHRR
jgi:dTDP-glucose 4,6-dehydratase